MKRKDEILLAYRKERERFYLALLEILIKKYPNLSLDELYTKARGESNYVWSVFAEGLEELEACNQSRQYSNYFYDEEDE